MRKVNPKYGLKLSTNINVWVRELSDYEYLDCGMSTSKWITSQFDESEKILYGKWSLWKGTMELNKSDCQLFFSLSVQGAEKIREHFKYIIYILFGTPYTWVWNFWFCMHLEQGILFGTHSDFVSNRGRCGDLTHICISRGIYSSILRVTFIKNWINAYVLIFDWGRLVWKKDFRTG
jgi:hypothetical protein